MTRNEPFLGAGNPRFRALRRPSERDVVIYDRPPVPGFDPTYGFQWAPPPGDMGTAGRGPKDVFLSLWRNKAWIGTAMLACAVAAVALASTMPVRYSAKGLLALDTKPVYMPQLGMQLPPMPPDPTAARSEAQILSSPAMVGAVARNLKLDQNPDLNPYLQDPGPVTLAMGWLQRQFKSSDDTAPPSMGDPVWEAVVYNVQRNLSVGNDGRSYVIHIGFESGDPGTSAAVVNTLMRSFVQGEESRVVEGQEDANSWVKKRADELRAEVEAADAKVQQYRSRNSLVETRGGTVSSQQLNEINTQLTLVRAARAEAEARYNRAREEARKRGSSDATFEVINSDLIQRLREQESTVLQRRSEVAGRLGSKHPTRVAMEQQLADVRQQIGRETDRIMNSLATQVRVARSREASLERQLSGQENLAMRSAAAEVGLRQLEREAETKRSVYQAFLATAQQTATPMRFSQQGARIVSEATIPTQPSGPKKGLFGAGGAFAGFLLASAATLLFGDRRRTFEVPSEIEGAFDLPVIGAVPVVSGLLGRTSNLAAEVAKHADSALCESLRGIRVALTAHQPVEGGTVILFTSAEPGEGKSSIAGALAANAVQDGLRVLLVDSDLRRPSARKTVTAGPGLVETLKGECGLEEAVFRDPLLGVDCLTPRGRVNSPASLLVGGRWDSVIATARKSYDLILLDSPPVMRVADALVLSRHADSTVLVVGHDTTRRWQVEETLRRFADADVSVSSIVLSKVPGGLFQRQLYYAGYAT